MLPLAAILAQPQVGGRPAAALTSEQRTRLGAMFDAHHDLVWRVLRRFAFNEAQADDGAQQVFLVALGRLDDLDRDKERAFLCATALMVARKWRSAPPREQPTEHVPEVESGSRPDEETELRRQRAVLDRLLAKMDDDLRSVFVLQEIEGLSKRETAEALGIPQGTVATRLRRARVAFDELLREDLGGQRP